MLAKVSAYLIVFLFIFALIFHVIVAAGFIPMDMVWGGKMESREQLLVFESISITLNLVFLFTLLAATNLIKSKMPEKLKTITLWVMALIFVLNTLGNIFSENELEKIIFTPITALISACLFVIIFHRRKASSKPQIS